MYCSNKEYNNVESGHNEKEKKQILFKLMVKRLFLEFAGALNCDSAAGSS